MLNKLLVSASVAGLIVGSASALKVDNFSVGNGTSAFPVPLSQELDFAGTGVTSTAGQTRVTFYPTAGTFPTGNVLVNVDVTGGTFATALTGAEITGAAPGVISSGGVSGGTSVVFLISGTNACNASGACLIDLPLDLTGTDVTVAVGIQTDAGAPVDNSSATNKVSATVVDTAPSFKIAIVPDTVQTNATLASLFKAVVTDSVLGTVDVTANSVVYGLNPAETVNKTLAGADVAGADVAAVNVVVSGVMDAFDPNVLPAGGDFLYNAVSFGAGVNSVADTATADIAAVTTINAGAPASINFVADTVSAIARSNYSAAVTVVPAALSPIKAGTSLTSDLQNITRDGTQVTFPWTQTGTLGAASGTTSVYRIGNLDSSAAGAVFVEAKNSTTAGYVNPGIVQVAATIPAKGELVLNSSSVEAALGNYGRGDVEFTIEAQSNTLTGRQFVVRNGAIQQVMGGTVTQDQN